MRSNSEESSSIEKWPIEEIHNEATFLRRLHFTHVDKQTNKPAPAGFDQKYPDLSCDWQEYTTIPDMRERMSREHKKDNSPKNPDEFSICSFNVGQALELEDTINAIHNPTQNIPDIIGKPNNRAHSLLYCKMETKYPNGTKEKLVVKARFQLAKISMMVHMDKINDNNPVMLRRTQ